VADSGGVPLPYQAPLKALAGLAPEEFSKTLTALEKKKLATSKVLADDLGQAAPELSQHAQGIVNASVSLMGHADSNPDRAKAIAQAVSTASVLEISSDRQAEFADRLAKILCSPAIRFTSKALALSADHENVYVDSRIITDVRPVFPDDTNSMAAAVITDHLRVSFYDRKSDLSTIYVALDQGDLIDLRDEIDRALAKNNSMRNFLEASDVDHLTEDS
jgi:hypothetical protein